MVRRLAIACCAALTTLIATPAGAGAATQIGHTLTPTGTCGAGFTFLQSQDSAPSDGVITSWDFQAGASNVPQLKFKVARLASGSTYTIVGESSTVTPTPGTLNHDLVRIPVKAGDLIGFYTVTSGGCDTPNPSFTELYATGDIAPGAQAPFASLNYEMDVTAALEADADNDGFGDETQDKCVGTPGPTNGCPNVVTAITGAQVGKKPQIQLTVTVPGAGTLKAGDVNDASVASASAVSVTPVTKTLTSTTKQQVPLTLSLTKQAKKRLKKKGKLRVQVKVVYTPVGGAAGPAQVASVKLKSKKKK